MLNKSQQNRLHLKQLKQAGLLRNLCYGKTMEPREALIFKLDNNIVWRLVASPSFEGEQALGFIQSGRRLMG